MKITVNPTKTFQTFEGFGASGAWWAQIVGGWKSIDKSSGKLTKDFIAELLYNKESGIGLRTYRYNLGSGSAASGKGDYSDFARRAESFSDTCANYDFSKDENAVYMMEQSVKNGADEVIFFVNSPLESMTKNGLGHHSKCDYFITNLKKECIDDFCKYCLDVTEYFIKKGIPIKYISPVNEPVWKWDGGQEGCHYRPKESRKVFLTFAREMKKRDSLSSVLLSGAENGDIRWFNKMHTRALLNNEEIKSRCDGIDLHSYFHIVKIKNFIIPFLNNRIGFLKRYKKWMDKHYPDAKIKMSEWTHMEGSRDYGMDSALYMAKIMYEDISILNVTSWQHWIACSHYDYNDGLIYIDPKTETFELTKRYYVTGNFSKFIPFNAKRAEATCDDNNLSVLAFIKDNETILIIINATSEEKSYITPLDSLVFVTDENRNLEKISIKAEDKLKITPKSVTTIIFKEEKI